ncbi:MAG: ABC transporter substrate-binding protein [Candidatus Bipolaricaulota bacterium]|nr:ABC transporter substrate-binding protein [Candidatus Bipolaricaulota bacterium]
MRLRGVLSVVLLIGALTSVLGLAQQGPFADGIIYDVRMQEEIALQDVAAGNIDIFQYNESGNVIFGLDQATLDQLELYVVPSGTDSFIFNNYPDKAPYIAVTTNGEELFNPFAVREIRFAMHLLVNRQQLVDEILQGAGAPSIVAVGPNEPGAYKLYLEASKLGLTNEGDEARAIEMVTAAMEAAAKLPENVGRLARGADGFWAFDGKPVTMKFLIRVDDPNVRLPLGRYFADQVEKCGIKCDRVERDRTYCIRTAYLTDPKDYLWNLYTEGWGAGGTSLYKDVNITQMYAPWYTNMPGGGEATWWNYQNANLDAWTQKIIYGQFATLEEYWDLMTKATAEGLKEAVRVYLIEQSSYFAANKAAFEARFLYGLGDGFNNFSMYTMVPTNKDRPVRITQYSARGSLFLNAWDPIGTQGFNDMYAANIIQQVTDPTTTNAPGSAAYSPILVSWKNVNVQVDFAADGTAVGKIEVPAAAVEWNSTQKAWVSTGGEIAWAEGDYSSYFPKSHDGSEMSLLDYAACEGFATDWATEDYAGDPYYDSAYSTSVAPGFAYTHGSIWNFKDGTLHTYFDNNFPPDIDRVGSSGVPALYPRAANHAQGVKWTVVEALGKLIAEGSASGTVYSFTQQSGVTEVDILVPAIVADIRAKFVEMRDAKFVPAYLVDLLPAAGKTADDIAQMYQQAIDFIDAHGHAYIGNGGYYIDSFDPANSQMTLKAYRDPSYPFSGQYWLDTMEVGTARVDQVILPAVAKAGADVAVTIKASEGRYPYDIFEPASKAVVSLVFVTGAGETTVAAKLTQAGTYAVVIPGSLTKGLAAGAYTVVAIAAPADGLPSAAGATLLLQ